MRHLIRIVVADDHAGMRTTLRLFFSRNSEIEIVGVASNGTEAIQCCRRHTPDILLLDLSMGGTPATELVLTLKAVIPRLRVLVFSAYESPAMLSRMIEAGIAGYVLKDDAPEELIPAVHAVARGATWYSRRITRRFEPVHDKSNQRHGTHR